MTTYPATRRSTAKRYDSLGRQLRGEVPSRPEPIDVANLPTHQIDIFDDVLAYLAIHGYAPASFLWEHVRDRYKSKQNFGRWLSDTLYDGGFVAFPRFAPGYGSQRVVELRQKGIERLRSIGRYHPSFSLSSSPAHDLMVGSCTGSMHTIAKHTGWKFKSAHEITDNLKLTVKRNDRDWKLEPDALTSLTRPDNNELFLIWEIDRRQESRKIIKAKLTLYKALIEGNQYQAQYGFTKPPRVVFVFNHPNRIPMFLELAAELGGCPWAMAQSIEGFDGYDWRPPTAIFHELFYGAWKRTRGDFFIPR